MRRTGLTLPRLAALAAGFLLLGGTVAAQAAPKIQVHFIAGHGETWTDPDPSDANNVSTLGPFAANAAIPLTDTAYTHRKDATDNKLQWSWILNADPTRTVDDIKQDDAGCTPWAQPNPSAASAKC